MTRINTDKAAVNKACNAASEMQGELSKNVQRTNNAINGELSQWKDAHVAKYVNLSEQIEDTIGKVQKQLDAIINFCQQESKWIDLYNE